jgi:ADP-ribosylglycohydrolase
MSLTRKDRIAGGLLGMLVGDALGVPYEFNPPEELPPSEAIEMEPPPRFFRSHAVPSGTWSDDGAQGLCLLASLLEQGRFDLDDFGRRLLRWYGEGYMAVDGRVFDVGIQTAQSLRRLREGTPASRSGASGEHQNGNGSLMRVLPLALWHRGADADLVADAHAQSLVTHGHLRSQVCCALYCLWARQTLEVAGDPRRESVAALRDVYGADSPARRELDEVVRPDDPPAGRGSGYVLDCLHSARLCQGAGDYESVVKAAVLLGDDTDTTACVAGGIAGIRGGVEGIPPRWRAALRAAELYRPLLDGLLASAS